MFTGIVEAVGTLIAMEPKGQDVSVRVRSGKLDLSDVKLGDSIATNGVCLTVVALPGDGYVADVSGETIKRTGFAHYKVGQTLNLERALTPTTRLGGHLVSGHVDGVGEIVSVHPLGRAMEYWIKAPDELARYIAEKGSITVDGISLTVNAVEGARFKLTIVPHTTAETTVGSWRPGSRVNLEVDLIARYLERLMLGDQAAQPASAGITLETLAQHGFLR
ncbi:riboflavin synthase [Pseudaeromonas sp. ZJS20]|uniref:riboflavin synthase n=1 Tax=Pseudaeromonas aegiceratis TaxID=3153928 RepID=UPI00390C7769